MILKESVIDNWGNALKNIAVEQKQVDRYIAQATVLIDLLKNRNDFVQILSVRTKDFRNQQLKIVDETFAKNGVNEYLVNAMKMLVETGSFPYARAIFKSMRKKLMALQDLVYGVVWSTTKISDKQILTMEIKVSKKLKKQVKLVNKIDEKLIGGVQIIVANNIFDGTIKGRLDQLRYEALAKK
ncbi:F0F1 ATP synthase subunit delta [Williamsoniiplasma somnilux]|uniref:ATP synthase subunit delta n=1 Tax=Williamsoniiplasma somnilux TaxID=215578 RepID=A0A2K8NZ03_9MOLU|nr:F0F1 ATP synthase subunit delta [Williamsoniiplasma somnilux]ATZ19045.1 F0F1 ATP synthase subunit delta [Williamsoniiplasma somnilux]